MVFMKDELKSMMTEHWHYLALNAACKLNLFDKINEGQISVETLCIKNEWNKKALSHLIQFLLNSNYLSSGNNSILKLTEKGNYFKESNIEGLYYACINWSGEHLNAWQHLAYSIQSGHSSFEHFHQKPFFEYLNDNPDELDKYHKAMYQYALDDYRELASKIDFSKHNSVMDIGGGYGAVLNMLKKEYPALTCYLFDLPEVIDKVKNNSFEAVAGDFFHDFPKMAEAIIISRVIHDWNDEKAAIILKNCFNSLPDKGKLYLIENCVDKINIDLSLLSLNMTVMCESYERSSIEFISLCLNAGLKYESTIPLNQLQSILIFQK